MTPTRFEHIRWLMPALGLAAVLIYAFTGVNWYYAGPPIYIAAGAIILTLSGLLVWGIATARQPNPAAPKFQPGWYPDHQNPTNLRWHDGNQWTQHVTQRTH